MAQEQKLQHSQNGHGAFMSVETLKAALGEMAFNNLMLAQRIDQLEREKESLAHQIAEASGKGKDRP